MAIETIKFGRDEFKTRSILAFYDIKDDKGYHISAHTTLGTRFVCESASKEKIEEKMTAISGQLKMVGLDNFAFVGGSILNMDEVKHVDLEHTPWLSTSLSKQVVATFKNETKLTIGGELNTMEEQRQGREIVADYDKQKHEYRNAQSSIDLNAAIADTKPTPIQ